MEKLTNEEKARLNGLAKNYDEKVRETWDNVYRSLNADQKEFINGYASNIGNELTQHLKSGKKPSDYFKEQGKWLFDGCILKRTETLFCILPITAQLLLIRRDGAEERSAPVIILFIRVKSATSLKVSDI